MNYPFREYLQVCAGPTGKWVQCTRCLHMLCHLGEDWEKACKTKTYPPTKAGPLMNALVGHYLLRKLHCPSCGALFDSEMVEEKH